MFPQPTEFYEYVGERRDIKLTLTELDQESPTILPLAHQASDIDIRSLCVYSQGRLLTNNLQNPTYYDYTLDQTDLLKCLFVFPTPQDTNIIVTYQLKSPIGAFVDNSAIQYESLFIPPLDDQIEQLTLPVELSDELLFVFIQGLIRTINKDYEINPSNLSQLLFEVSDLIHPNSYINIKYGVKKGTL